MLAAANAHRIAGQSSRANLDEDEELSPEMSSAFPTPSSMASSTFTCTMNPPVTRKLEEISAIFIHNNVAHGVCDGLVETNSVVFLTNIKVNDRTVYEVLVSKSHPNSLLFKSTNGLLGDQEINNATRFLLESTSLKEVIILDGLVAAKFIPHNDNSGHETTIENLRVIRTKSFDRSEWLEQVNVGNSYGTSFLEEGNIVAGCTASIMCACDVRNIPALALFSLREAAFDIRAAKRFEAYWQIFCSKFLLSDGQLIDAPSAHVYNNLRKNDPFMLSTETLYT